ncbi:RmlC-like cupin domain-containing protein [Exophiala viscosa]|uniref:RmlC-like cupin domain-containing protein n=1 Tax=Exophiala viscosa TaxID=2486360 RepID=A0AAN6IE00_9EURO|nr:RmlC-like cupin domain-containing protein [Exophiala viscosa]KAI1622497.1 RmlC-like cupin domain-containing protein [Exophiala viscosa]
MGTTQKSLQAVKVAPGRPGQPYILPSLGGEIIYIPCSKSATRLLVTGKETDNAFAVVGTGGAQGDPIGFHYHRETHDVFLCLKGKVNVWANDQCRTMEAGDFASVPPGTVHQYQILGDYTEFVGLIVPGGWEEFFRFIGESYDGPLFPLEDDRNVFEVLIPKLKAASEKFDMIPVRDPKLAEIKPQAWNEGEDNVLPNGLQPYFLRAGTGPRFLLGGMVVSPLATAAESGGRFSIGSIEGSSWHESSPLSKNFVFDDVHHAFQVADGSVTFTLDETEVATLNVGETIYVPRGRAFSLAIESRYARVYVFISGRGILDVLTGAGKPFYQSVPPEKSEPWEKASLEKYQADIKFRIAE